MSTSTTQRDSENSSSTLASTGNGISAEARARVAEFSAIFREGVHEAQEESRRLGVPNVYEINGVIHYELPNGELTTEDPYPAIQAAQQDANSAG